MTTSQKLEQRAARFWAKVERTDSCWLYIGGSDDHGYRSTSWFGHKRYVHRIAYELTYGPIPNGMQIDHVRERGCLHRHCVNPAHLEAVTPRTNLLRGRTVTARNAAATHCPQGHPYDEKNTVWVTTPRGTPGRVCRECRRLKTLEYNRRTRPVAQPKTHCKHGHPLSGSNLIVRKNGHRACRECGREAKRRFYQRHK